MNLTNADVADILALLDSLPYDELDLQTSRFRLILRRTPAGWTQSEVVDAAAGAGRGATMDHRGRYSDSNGPSWRSEGDTSETVEVSGAEAPSGVQGSGGDVAVRAPLPGTFYRAPRPGAEPFVEVGSLVGAEDVVGIVETMKLMNAVHAGIAGTVSEICLGNGEFAAQGATLMRIEAEP